MLELHLAEHYIYTHLEPALHSLYATKVLQFPPFTNLFRNYCMNNKQLKKVKQSLPRGYRNLISKETGFSVSHIDHVLAGRRFNQSIVNAAIDLLEKHFDSIEESSKRISLVLIDLVHHWLRLSMKKAFLMLKYLRVDQNAIF